MGERESNSGIVEVVVRVESQSRKRTVGVGIAVGRMTDAARRFAEILGLAELPPRNPKYLSLPITPSYLEEQKILHFLEYMVRYTSIGKMERSWSINVCYRKATRHGTSAPLCLNHSLFGIFERRVGDLQLQNNK